MPKPLLARPQHSLGPLAIRNIDRGANQFCNLPRLVSPRRDLEIEPVGISPLRGDRHVTPHNLSPRSEFNRLSQLLLNLGGIIPPRIIPQLPPQLKYHLAFTARQRSSIGLQQRSINGHHTDESKQAL